MFRSRICRSTVKFTVRQILPSEHKDISHYFRFVSISRPRVIIKRRQVSYDSNRHFLSHHSIRDESLSSLTFSYTFSSHIPFIHFSCLLLFFSTRRDCCIMGLFNRMQLICLVALLAVCEGVFGHHVSHMHRRDSSERSRGGLKSLGYFGNWVS